MPGRLADQIVLIFGGSSGDISVHWIFGHINAFKLGIGKAAAKEVISEGGIAWIIGRTYEKLQLAAKEVRLFILTEATKQQ